MTLVPGQGDGTGSESGGPHPGELTLRRFRAGELGADKRAEINRHTGACPLCKTKLAALEDEQKAFEHAIPFARFAGGVERAARVPRARTRRVSLWMVPAFSLVAAAAVLLFARGENFFAPRDDASETGGQNRRKGASDVTAELRIAPGDGSGQRQVVVDSKEKLGRGDRVRIGIASARPRHAVVLSIDDGGVVTPLYPEHGQSLPLEPGPGLAYLPGSLEFEGAGNERVFVFVAEAPFAVETAAAAVSATRARHGDVGAGAASLARVDIPGVPALQTFSWVLEKP
jgi:uncharacterized protein YbaR (Trm112 family)